MAGSVEQRQESDYNLNSCELGSKSNKSHTGQQFEARGLYDATLVMTLSSVKQLLLDTSNEITLSYYVLLTNCENNKKEK